MACYARLVGLEVGVLLDGVFVDGLELGECVGLAVGREVGAFVGLTLGNEVGLADGAPEGAIVGLAEGVAEGIIVEGKRDGLDVLGLFVGDTVGNEVLGFMEGFLLDG